MSVQVVDTEENASKRRVDMCPEEWADDFGPEFYEHTLENGFYYIAPQSEWHSQAKSVSAPGMEQFGSFSPEQLQLSIKELTKETETENGD